MHSKANTFIHGIKSCKNVYSKEFTAHRKDITQKKQGLMLASDENW